MHDIPSGIAAIAGIIIGSLTSIITVWLQRKHDYKREIIKLAFEIAKEERNSHIQNADKSKITSLLPIDVYYYYHYKILKVLTSDSMSIEKKVLKVKHEQDGFNKVYYDYYGK